MKYKNIHTICDFKFPVMPHLHRYNDLRHTVITLLYENEHEHEHLK